MIGALMMAWVIKRSYYLLLVSVLGVIGYELVGQVGFASAVTTTAKQPDIAASSPGDWPQFQNNLWHSGFNGWETVITGATASRLKVHWKRQAGGSISTQVVESNGLIYWGSWDGIEHASTLNGNGVWTTNLGQTTSQQCAPPTVGVASTASVATVPINGIQTAVVFVGGGNGIFYALNAANGHIIWQTRLGTPPAYFLWSSPVVYNGSVYEGVSSFGDCPLVRGEMVRMDASTGAIGNIFYTMPDGCKGAGVWDTPAIDLASGMLYFGTSNAGACNKPGQFFWSMIEVHAADLSLVSSWQLPPSQRTPNCDFGLAAPTLFTATIGGVNRLLLGTPNQNGKYYA